MRFRQAVIEYSNKHGVTKAAIRYHLNRQYIYRWRKRYDGTLQSLADRSHRPQQLWMSTVDFVTSRRFRSTAPILPPFSCVTWSKDFPLPLNVSKPTTAPNLLTVCFQKEATSLRSLNGNFSVLASVTNSSAHIHPGTMAKSNAATARITKSSMPPTVFTALRISRPSWLSANARTTISPSVPWLGAPQNRSYSPSIMCNTSLTNLHFPVFLFLFAATGDTGRRCPGHVNTTSCSFPL